MKKEVKAPVAPEVKKVVAPVVKEENVEAVLTPTTTLVRDNPNDG